MPNTTDPKLGRRDYDELEVVDVTNKLTTEELAELKRLASLSKTSRMFVIAVIAIVSTLGLPTIIDWFGRHIKW